MTRSFKSKLMRARPLQARVISGGDMAAPAKDTSSPKKNTRNPRAELPEPVEKFSRMVISKRVWITKQGADESKPSALGNE